MLCVDIKVTEDEKENLIDHIVFNSRGLKYKSITLTSLDYDVIIPDSKKNNSLIWDAQF